MSSVLVAYPKAKGFDLSFELKMALKKRFLGEFDWPFDSSEIPYLSGLRDAGIEGAQKLIDLIEKFGEVIVKEEY